LFGRPVLALDPFQPLQAIILGNSKVAGKLFGQIYFLPAKFLHMRTKWRARTGVPVLPNHEDMSI